MAEQILCEYCGAFIDANADKCPNCGAVNRNKRRAAKDTPRTIDELKDWYRARNLPPEETTRFFIGKDIREPRAFGIYRDGSNVIVYKNKADGTRVIRYEGPDEAYGVRELYLKLKEEILNQKNSNSRKRAGNRSSAQRYRRKKRNFPVILVIILAAVISMFVGFVSVITSQIDREVSPMTYYCNGESLYYYDGRNYKEDTFDWWYFDEDLGDYRRIAIHGKNDFPAEITYKDKYRYVFEINDKFGTDYPNIYDSENYVDSGHHYEPSSGYYIHGDQTYYYLDDYYTDDDYSGWYLWDNGWTYYSSYDDEELVFDDFWYHSDDYYAGHYYDSVDAYDFSSDEQFDSWDVSQFEDTGWYESYQTAYDQYWEEHGSSDDDDDSFWDWSSDSDWDWDSDDSWDSDYSDWDSDW